MKKHPRLERKIGFVWDATAKVSTITVEKQANI